MPDNVNRLPNFATKLKNLGVMQVRKIEGDTANISFVEFDELVGDDGIQNIQPRFQNEVVVLEDMDASDIDLIYYKFRRKVREITSVGNEVVNIEPGMTDPKIKGKIVATIYSLINNIVMSTRSPGEHFVIVNYRMACFLNNNTEKEFRNFHKKEMSFDFIIDDDLGDEIIIGCNNEINGPIFYFFNEEMTKGKLHSLPISNKFFKRIIIERNIKPSIVEKTESEPSEPESIDAVDLLNGILTKEINKIQPDLREQEEVSYSTNESNSNDPFEEDEIDDDYPSIEEVFEIQSDDVEMFDINDDDDNYKVIIVNRLGDGDTLRELYRKFFGLVIETLRDFNPSSVVTNGKLMAIIQDSPSYTIGEINNFTSNVVGEKYKMGSLAGVDFYVDPLMRWDDDRYILVKGDDTFTIEVVDENNLLM